MISLFYPQIYKEEWLEALEKVFSGKQIAQGGIVDEFDKEFAKKFGYDNALSVNSGTSALELAYHLLGIQPWNEVIASVFGCTATTIGLIRRAAKLVFCDVDETMTASYESIVKKITPHTKAIVVTNLGGITVDDRIFDLGIPVVVDACQSLGINQKYGDFIAYSFQAIKHFTTFDGGMLVCKNQKDYERAKKLRWFGIDREQKKRVGWDCLINHPMAMNIEEPGYKYHMNDAIASLGLIGLKHSDEILEKRKSLCERYVSHFEGKVKYFCGGSYWMFGIFLDNRNEIIVKLREAGIETDLVHLRNDIFDVFGGKKLDLPNMNKLEDRYVYIPLHCKLTFDDVDFIAEKVLELNDRKN